MAPLSRVTKAITLSSRRFFKPRYRPWLSATSCCSDVSDVNSGDRIRVLAVDFTQDLSWRVRLYPSWRGIHML